MKYKIKVDNQYVEVTEEVYKVYYQMDRKERYLIEKDSAHNLNYYHALDCENMCGEEIIVDEKANVLETIVRKSEKETLYLALSKLRENEKDLIIEIYFSGKSEYKLAEEMGISRNSVHIKKERILKKLRKMLEE